MIKGRDRERRHLYLLGLAWHHWSVMVVLQGNICCFIFLVFHKGSFHILFYLSSRLQFFRALLKKLHLYNIERMDNSALGAAISACPSLLDLEIVGLWVSISISCLNCNSELVSTFYCIVISRCTYSERHTYWWMKYYGVVYLYRYVALRMKPKS